MKKIMFCLLSLVQVLTLSTACFAREVFVPHLGKTIETRHLSMEDLLSLIDETDGEIKDSLQKAFHEDEHSGSAITISASQFAERLVTQIIVDVMVELPARHREIEMRRQNEMKVNKKGNNFFDGGTPKFLSECAHETHLQAFD